jgi:hypothetical protein
MNDDMAQGPVNGKSLVDDDHGPPGPPSALISAGRRPEGLNPKQSQDKKKRNRSTSHDVLL